MRREGDRHRRAERRELLLDLGRVAVARDAVGVDVLVDGDEVGRVGGRAAGAGDAGLGVDHDVGDQARAGERREREDRGGRVAARVGDEVGVADLLAVELGQPVDGALRSAPARGAARTTPRRSRRRAAGSRR